MTAKEYKSAIKAFSKKYKNKTIIFCALEDETEKLIFVALNGYNYFKSFMSGTEAHKRGLRNAVAHANDDFLNYPAMTKLKITD